MLISIGYMCLMLCSPLDWQYAEFPSSAMQSCVLCSFVRCWTSKQIEKKTIKKNLVLLFLVEQD